jgi:uncharacterized membrane protein
MSDPTVPPPPPPYYTPPPAAQGGGTVSSNRSIMIVLSYLWLLALVPLLAEKEDREVQWHAKHGLVLFGAEIILWVCFWVLQWMLILTHILAVLGCLLVVVQFALAIGIMVLHLMCIVKGVKGQRLLIPGISQYADKF